ncbi:MAG: 1-deoxy-D-xylulose-5-phosphate synthase N-terminal domain-containing protein [Anaerolineae bacterium]|nr:1-deoxy-D-xylulose-5-phosphate synthase N-terminal domain-containing protein [Anaerolineae bacterium]
MDAEPHDQTVETQLSALSAHFPRWEIVKDIVDQLIALTVNLRQSGHPGGSRSKVHAMVATLLSGVMRWDIRQPEKRFTDRFILVGGHAVPLIYCTLAVLSEALRIKHEQTGDPRYLIRGGAARAVYPEDLVTFRHNRGLSGHAEMEGKTLFVKYNTGPSGHGSPAAAGQALALKYAGAGQVRVFAMEGDGGLTTGVSHETMNSAWGLGLGNLYYLVDWNDYGIDDHPISRIVHGNPGTWFAPHGWRTYGTEYGMDWEPVTRVLLRMTLEPNPQQQPTVGWFKTRKGRNYLVYDNKSHGAPHAPMNCELFWRTVQPFAERYGVEFEGRDRPCPEDPREQTEQTLHNIELAISVLRRDQALVDYLADRLVELGEQVPAEVPTLRYNFGRNPLRDPALYDYEHYPAEMYVSPGTRVANRAALARFGAWINAYCHEHYGRPLFLVASADLAESTNIAGFGKAWGSFAGYGPYDRERNPEGVVLPQGITEFANAGIMTGLVSVNLADDPEAEFSGFLGACSTYGSFSYLKYGPFRLFSQMAQDCQLKLGKIIWVAGHSGPETADDSRTHFGIFAPGVTQLFPRGQIINLHPWEHNEVPVVLGAALAQSAPLIALHLTRPPITVPDREALGMPSHFAAARGAYVIRPYRPGQPRMGTVIVQGTSTTAGVVQLLPELDRRGLNVKIVAAISPELFALQPQPYREEVLSAADRLDSMAITNGARRLMHDWLDNRVAEEYTLSSDWDDRWRTGGTVDELLAEAHLSPDWLLKGIERFALERPKRLAAIRQALQSAEAQAP